MSSATNPENAARRARRDRRRWQGMDSPRLTDTGLAIFRSVDERQLHDAFGAMFRALGGLVIRHRLQHDQKPLAVSLVEMSEVLCQPALQAASTEEAIEAIHAEVPSLSRPVNLRASGLIFASRTPAEKSLGVAFVPEDTNQLQHERQEALAAIESLIPYDPQREFSWYRDKHPHISLGRVAARHVREISKETLEPIIDALPPVIRAQRATYHKQQIA